MKEQQMISWIAAASYEELLHKWRFEPAGSPWFQGDVGKFFDTTMRARKKEIGHDAAVRASKNVGWQK